MRVLVHQWTIWYVVALHCLWAALLMIDSSASRTTPLATATNLFSVPGTVVFLIIGAVLTGVAVTHSPSLWTITLKLPQLWMLLLASFSSINAAVVGHYADGVVRPHAFIMADQMLPILLSAFYVLAILDRHGALRWKR